VLFSGELVSGAQEDRVRENLARELGIDQRKAGQLFSGRTVVIRSQMLEGDAMVLQARLQKLGALARIKNLAPSTELKLDYRIDRQERVADQTLRDITAAHLECPRCGHLQLDASHCTRCGVDIAASIKAKRKEDRLIQKKIRELKGQQSEPAPEADRFRTRREDRIAPRQSEGRTGKIKAWFSKTS
jgi:ribosomal protein L37E